MNWIIWTCGWWLTITLGLLIDAKRYQINGTKPDGNAVVFECVILLGVWVIGIVHFWQ